ncbi:MAG: hypothetical protein JNL12_02505 [Planctomycetes bacterium]|nr:hypothetical protein [Planctomycetota bacterium]
MSSLPPDPSAALGRIADEMTRLRGELAAMARRLDTLADDNRSLQARLEQSEQARRDLAAQADHLIELLGEARTELRTARGPG